MRDALSVTDGSGRENGRAWRGFHFIQTTLRTTFKRTCRQCLSFLNLLCHPGALERSLQTHTNVQPPPGVSERVSDTNVLSGPERGCASGSRDFRSKTTKSGQVSKPTEHRSTRRSRARAATLPREPRSQTPARHPLSKGQVPGPRRTGTCVCVRSARSHSHDVRRAPGSPHLRQEALLVGVLDVLQVGCRDLHLMRLHTAGRGGGGRQA